MKMLEQTKRAISVGLITAAWVVIVASATLFCGVTSARADEPDNRIDWRWGRPGVMVVTNAPTALTVTNIATTVTIEVAGGVAENLFGPRVSALEDALDCGTNNWNTAFSWGDHAGLYRAIGWVPSWGDLTDIPQDFPPSTHEHDYTTITNPPWLTSFTETDEIALSRVTVLEGGTNNWNTAYGWGDHAGLYKASDWVPSWTDVTDKPSTFPPEAHQHDYTTITNPPWLEEYTETDPIWTGVSNTVTVGAALGATAVQAESDPVAMAALAGYQSAAYWPPNATASSWFTYITNSGAITITSYNIDGGTAVVIPDYINGLPVTEIGANAFFESGVTSIGGAGNVVTVGDYAFESCYSLASVPLPQVQTVGYAAFNFCYSLTSISLRQAQTVGDYAFSFCQSLTSVPMPQVQTVGASAFDFCTSLTSVSLPQVQTVESYAFNGCTSLTSLYFGDDAPTIGTDIFAGITPNQVTIYVTNPQATGWGATFGGMPVVRLPLYADAMYQAGELVATEAHVAEQIAGKVDAVSGLASNLWLQGETIVSDSYTNLWWRNVYSNGWHWLVAYTNAPGGGE